MKALFYPGFMLIVGVVAAVTPCSPLFVFPLVGAAFVFGLGRRSALETEDAGEMPNQLTLFAISAVFGSLVNILIMVLLSARK